MDISTTIEYADIKELKLDPNNPRLGRSNTKRELSQADVLEIMRGWSLEELAVSFLESGFWVQEALMIVEEDLQGENALIVVEGNRRLAALLYLYDAFNGKPASKKWTEIVQKNSPPNELFSKIPFLKAGSRKEIEAFIGFRHVTGIKEWKPAEKAEYIARLIEDNGMDYVDVMRQIGNKTPVVQQHYISYRLLLQMEDNENISIEHVVEKFSVLYLSLRTAGVRDYLRIDIKAEPETAKHPVPKDRLDQLASFALWLFGDEKRAPLFTDSRLVDKFGQILESQEAIAYLERSESPKFDVAYRTAGGDEPELVKLIQTAADNIELALRNAHRYKKSEEVLIAVERFGADALQLLNVFPKLRDSLMKDDD